MKYSRKFNLFLENMLISMPHRKMSLLDSFGRHARADYERADHLLEFVPASFHEADQATLRPVVSSGSPTGIARGIVFRDLPGRHAPNSVAQ